MKFASRRKQTGGRPSPIGQALVALVLAALLWACATVDKATDAMATREAATACQLADAGTTVYALHAGAVELNAIPVPALLAIKLGLAAWIWFGISDEQWAESPKGTRIFVSAVGCLPAANNINVIRQIR